MSAEHDVASKEREVQQLKNTLQHKNAQAHQASKLMVWHEQRREITDGSLQTIRNGLVALLHELDLLVARRNHTARS